MIHRTYRTNRWLLMLALLALPLGLWATDIDLADTNGNVLRYSFTGTDGVATLTRVVSLSTDEEQAKHIVVPASITDADGNPHTVAALGAKAFESQSTLVSIALPESVTTLGNYCFQYCTALETLNLPAGITAIPTYCFRDCYALNVPQLPAGVTTIAYEAFWNCYRMTEFRAPAALQSIEGYAFEKCTALAVVDFTDATELSAITSNSFSGCSAIREVRFNTKPTNATAVLSPTSVLESVTLGDGWTEVPNSCFSSKAKLKEVILGANITTIGSSAFSSCTALETLTLPAGLTTLGSYAFNACSALKSIALPDALTTLGNYAFYNCKALASVTVGSGLQSIGEDAFENCTALTSLDFSASEGLTTVGRYAFYGCTSLREVTFGTGVTSIDYAIFNGANAMQKLVLPGDTYPFSGSNSIGLPNQVMIYVPAALVETYQTNSLTSDYRIVPLGTQTQFAITTTSGGQLQEKVEATGTPAAVLELAVSGPLNGTDIDYLHHYLVNVQTLDLGAAQIVNGGDTYHQWTVASNGTATQSSQVGNTEADVIGDYMFYNMPVLRKLVLPQTATAIGRCACAGLPLLTDLTLPAEVQTIGYRAFASTYSGHSTSYTANRVQHLTLPATVTSIGQDAFANMRYLLDINIPEGITELPQYAFYACNRLKTVSLPSTLQSIGSHSFVYTKKLVAINLPDGLQTIGSYAFENSGLKNIAVPGTVTTIDTYAFYNCDSLRTATIGEGVTKLPDNAFYYSSYLNTVTLPSTLTSIGSSTFSYCRRLANIELPAGLQSLGTYAFYECDSLKTFTFPEAITSIPGSVLYGCDALTTVNIADGTTVIGNSAFRECPNLTEFDFNKPTLTKIDNYAFFNTGFTTVTLPDQVVLYGQCFQACKNLESINIPTATTYAPSNFVDGCTKLTSVQMHDGIRTINNYAFRNCSALESIDLNDAITSIGNYAFNGCTKLALTSLPTALTTIGQYAFSYCKALTTLTVPKGVTTVGGAAFAYSSLTQVSLPTGITSLGSSVFSHSTALVSVDWPADQKKIPDYTFQSCSALTDITLGEGLTTIGYEAFEYCSALKSIVFPESLKTIENMAFYNSGLTEVTIPDGVTSIGSNVFGYCQGLKEARLGRNMDYTSNNYFDYFNQCANLELLRVFAGAVPAINSSYAPRNRANCVLEVPMGMEEQYAAADVWKEFKEIRGFLTGDKLAAEDFALLKQFYAEMGGENWTHTWDLTTDDRYIGKWYGVTTEGDHVATITLNGNNLSGELKQTIFELPELTELNLSRNHITGSLGEVLEGRFQNEKLTTVKLSRNQLTGDIAAFANKLPNLSVLWLGFNRLTQMSAPLSDKLRTNSTTYLDYRYQFVDPDTYYGIDDAEQPALRVRLGEPFQIEMNSLQQYRAYYGDFKNDLPNNLYMYNRSFSNGKPYLSANGYSQFAKNSDGLYNVSTNNRFYGWKKGEVAPYELGSPNNWGDRIVNLILDWEDGDVNCDLTVDVADMQASIYYALRGSQPSGQPFNYVTADVNEDEAIDVRDVVQTIDRILAYEEESSALARALYKIMSSAENEEAYHATVHDGVLTLAAPTNDLSEGRGRAAAAQFLLSGCTADEISLEAGARGFSLKTRQTAEGVKVLLYSLSGKTLAGDVLRVPKTAELLDVRLTDESAERLACRIGNGADGLSSLNDGAAIEGDVYDMQGHLVGTGDVQAVLSTQPTGIYVINVDGKHIKVKK